MPPWHTEYFTSRDLKQQVKQKLPQSFFFQKVPTGNASWRNPWSALNLESVNFLRGASWSTKPAVAGTYQNMSSRGRRARRPSAVGWGRWYPRRSTRKRRFPSILPVCSSSWRSSSGKATGSSFSNPQAPYLPQLCEVLPVPGEFSCTRLLSTVGSVCVWGLWPQMYLKAKHRN